MTDAVRSFGECVFCKNDQATNKCCGCGDVSCRECVENCCSTGTSLRQKLLSELDKVKAEFAKGELREI